MGVKLFDVTKQYSCTEVHRLEAMQQLAQTLEDRADELGERSYVSGHQLLLYVAEMNTAAHQIQEFINTLIEQDRR